MGEALDRVVALAGTIRVEGHTRTSKTGKVVRVGAYTRSPGDMSKADLQAELKALSEKDVKSGLSAQEANRFTQIGNEVRKRIKSGEWDKSDEAPKKAADRHGDSFPGDLNPSRTKSDVKKEVEEGSAALKKMREANREREAKDAAQVRSAEVGDQIRTALATFTKEKDGWRGPGGSKTEEAVISALASTRHDVSGRGLIKANNAPVKESLSESVRKIQAGQGGTMGAVAEGLAKMGLGKSDEAKKVRDKPAGKVSTLKEKMNAPKSKAPSWEKGQGIEYGKADDSGNVPVSKGGKQIGSVRKTQDLLGLDPVFPDEKKKEKVRTHERDWPAGTAVSGILPNYGGAINRSDEKVTGVVIGHTEDRVHVELSDGRKRYLRPRDLTRR